MTKNEILHIRVDSEVKNKAEQILEKLGISISDAIYMFLRQVVYVRGLPFEVELPAAPDSVIIKSAEDLNEKLRIGLEQIDEGNTIGGKTVMKEIEKRIISQ